MERSMAGVIRAGSPKKLWAPTDGSGLLDDAELDIANIADSQSRVGAESSVSSHERLQREAVNVVHIRSAQQSFRVLGF